MNRPTAGNSLGPDVVALDKADTTTFDLALFQSLNEEYQSKPLVPSPRSDVPLSREAEANKRAQVLARYYAKLNDNHSLNGKRVLEIGCGRGETARMVADDARCEVVGVDVVESRYWAEYGGNKVSLYKLDVSQTPYKHLGQFDFIYSFSVWEHIQHPFAALKAAYTLLRPGGTMYLSANLYRGPKASHRYREVFFPWPHLLFTEEVFAQYYSSIGMGPVRPAWVNKLVAAEYLAYFDAVGFDARKVWYKKTAIDWDFYNRFAGVLGRYPLVDLERDFIRAFLVKTPNPSPLRSGKKRKPEFDLALFTSLNEEYKDKPLVDRPRSQESGSLSSEGSARVERLIRYYCELSGGATLSGKRVLEIGCGRGHTARAFGNAAGCEVVGVDIVQRRDWDCLEGNGVRFQNIDISVEPYRDLGQFDFIYSFSVWEHMRHPYAALKAAHALLKPECSLYVCANLYRGPRASHRYREVFFPWPHLLFNDEVFEEYYVSIGRKPTRASWVNKLVSAEYLLYFDRVGFQTIRVWYSKKPMDWDFYERFRSVLERYPRFDLERDFIHALLLKSPTIGRKARIRMRSLLARLPLGR